MTGWGRGLGELGGEGADAVALHVEESDVLPPVSQRKIYAANPKPTIGIQWCLITAKVAKAPNHEINHRFMVKLRSYCANKIIIKPFCGRAVKPGAGWPRRCAPAGGV